MKKEDLGIWNSLFGAKGKATEGTKTSTAPTEVFVTQGAQPHVLWKNDQETINAR